MHTQTIVKHNCQELLESVPFFENAPEVFITAVLTRLKFELFLPHEFIIRLGCKGEKMYFIQRGNVEVITEDGTVVTHLSEGAHFGEICLLMDERRVASIKATTMCDLFSLSKKNFQDLLEEFPEMRPFFETIAKKRLSNIGIHENEQHDRSKCCIHTRYSDSAKCSACKSPSTPLNSRDPAASSRHRQGRSEAGEREGGSVHKRGIPSQRSLSGGSASGGGDRTEKLRDQDYAQINPHFVASDEET